MPYPPLQAFAEDKESVKFLKDEKVKAKFANAKKLTQVGVTGFDAIFYVGGHGPVIDLPEDPVNIKLASDVSADDNGVRWVFLISS